ncbi:hypothetical protein HPB49_008062 [Dermacentor silvarum]|uniref:Uncharacterized protein n=1 Tax=Dermacentor silvarum TaxID=543639 RepID=A0ACB8CDV9_DERSI|nr:hypothetical protein HPB49_008062 [Dermacentor silvarum]
MNKVTEANETSRQENAALRTTINNLTIEIAEIQTTPSTSKAEEITTDTQETAVEEPAVKKRAVEATRKQTENDRIDNLEAKFEVRFTKFEQLITANIPAVAAMKQTMKTYQAKNTNRFAYIEKTLQPIVSHLTFAPLFAQHPPNQSTPYTPTQSWPPTQQPQKQA